MLKQHTVYLNILTIENVSFNLKHEKFLVLIGNNNDVNLHNTFLILLQRHFYRCLLTKFCQCNIVISDF